MFKKKAAFSGWNDVFCFTLGQEVKSKGFRGMTFGVAFVLFFVFFLLNVYMAHRSDKTQKPSPIGTVYVEDESGWGTLDFGAYVKALQEKGEPFAHVVFEQVEDFEERLLEDGSSKAVGLRIARGKEEYRMELWLPENSDIGDSDGNKLLAVLEGAIEQGKLLNSDIPIEKLALVKAPVQVGFSKAGEGAKSLSEELAKQLVPMAFSFGLYLLLLLYGQGVGKIVIAEKSSKLMEALLTSVQPYALLSGKILAMAFAAILQVFAWVMGGVLGFVAGDFIALRMSPEYENAIKEVVNLMRESTNGQAFTPLSVTTAALFVGFGFLFYSVWAGLVASHVGKAEDLAHGMSLYQTSVVLCFFVAYFGSLQSAGALVSGFVEMAPYIPFVAVFLMPGGLLVGEQSLTTGWVGFAILLASTLALVVCAGKAYKDKVFYQGETKGLAGMLGRIRLGKR